MGTELLLGQIANTNAQEISRSLAAIGIDVFFHVVVGDNIERAAETFATALERSDVVIATGGLGPTPDDLTAAGVARALGRPLVRDQGMAERIRSIFAALGREMPEENLKQADLPQGAVAIPPEGTAPGFRVEAGRKILFALPGVPWEMRAMLTKTVIPTLKERAGEAATVSRQVLVIGLGESATHQKIADLVAAQTNPTIAFLAGGGQVRVRITAKARDETTALGMIRPVEEAVRARLGGDALPGNPSSVGEALGVLLRETGATVAAAESLTGGLIASQLTHGPGASEFFKGSLVVYATEAKRDLAGVDQAILDGPGPVSEAAAEALARGAADRLGADLGISATGVAGPTEQDGVPVGTIYVGAWLEGRAEIRRVRGYGDRDNIRVIAATAALDLGRRVLAARTTS